MYEKAKRKNDTISLEPTVFQTLIRVAGTIVLAVGYGIVVYAYRNNLLPIHFSGNQSTALIIFQGVLSFAMGALSIYTIPQKRRSQSRSVLVASITTSLFLIVSAAEAYGIIHHILLTLQPYGLSTTLAK